MSITPTITMMNRNGTEDRVVQGHSDPVGYARSEAARLSETHIVLLHDEDGWQVVESDGDIREMTGVEMADLGIAAGE